MLVSTTTETLHSLHETLPASPIPLLACLKHVFTSAFPSIDCNMTASSSAVLPPQKMSSWVVSRTRQLSSKVRGTRSKSFLCVLQRKLPVSNNVPLDPSGTFSNVPFFCGHISAKESNKHSFMNSPSHNTLLLFFFWRFCEEIQNFTDESLFGCDTFCSKSVMGLQLNSFEFTHVVTIQIVTFLNSDQCTTN